MSKLSEYISLFPKGIKNADKIFAGIIKSVQLEHGKLPDREKEEIIRRRVICQNCPFNSVNARTSEEYIELTGKHYVTERHSLHCSFCGCPIKTKSSSLNSDCGITTWNEKHPEKQLELKWEKFE